jgi:molecular chaperone DnaK (HSP70)
MAKESKGELVVVEAGFNYSPLEPAVAKKVQATAEHIRETVKRTIEGIIEVGQDLIQVKEALPHGQFSPWLRAEFGWTERTARNFMAVAEAFGPKTEIISDLRIDPTAAYLLAAPSAPDEARQAAVKMAESGERITAKVAKRILAKERKKPAKRRTRASAEKLTERLETALARFRDQWNQKDLAELARQLREFADALDNPERGGRKKAKE